MKKILSLVLMLTLLLSLMVGCSNGETSTNATSDLEAAKAYLKSIYQNEPTTTASDFKRTNVVAVDGTSYKVEWTVEVADGAVSVEKGETEDTIKINVEKPAADIAYTLKATITAPDNTTAELVFEYTVPAYKEMTFADYMKAETGDAVMVKGVVSAIISKSKGNSNNSIYLQDTDGGYYVYGLESDPVTDLNLEVGMTVMATGEKDIYNGTHEVKSATLEIVDSNKSEVKPIDLTEAFKNATDLKDESLVGIQGALATISGVEIIGISPSNDSYYMFKLGALETYIRISSSSCPLTSDEQKTFIDTYNANLMKSATATGIVSVYDGKFYLIPATVDAYSNFADVERSDADKIAAEKAELSITDKFAVDKEIDLVLEGKAFTDVKISWASDNAQAVVKDGKLVVTLADTEQTAKITATLTCGEATDTVEFTITLGAKGKEEKPTGTAYYFALSQVKLGKNLYFAGAMDGNFLATTENEKDAVKVYVEDVEGGVRFYFMKDGERTYIDIHEYQAGKAGVQLTTEPTCVFVKNEEAKTYVANVAGADYYLGTYGTYSTISASKTSYITGDKAADVGVSQFVAGLYEKKLPAIETKPDDTSKEESSVADTSEEESSVADTSEEESSEADTSKEDASTGGYTIVTSPAVDTAYKFAITQANLGKDFYFTGELSGYFLATSEDTDSAVDVYVENAEGGYYLYFKKGAAKTYINIIERTDSANKQTIELGDEAKSIYKLDSASKTLITTLTFASGTEQDFYLGTYNDYSTLNSSKTSFISGDKAADIGVSQFPAYLVELN